MLKYAFLMNMPGEKPDTCSGEYNNQESHSRIVGIEKEAALEYVKKLTMEGFELVDLCGDFTQTDVETFAQVSGGKIKFSYAGFLPAEKEKMEKLDSLFEYGIIIFMKGVVQTEWVDILNRQGNTHVAFVADMEAAAEAARELVAKGVSFMELCSWFDKKKTEQIIFAIGGAVPIGSCGDLE